MEEKFKETDVILAKVFHKLDILEHMSYTRTLTELKSYKEFEQEYEQNKED